MTAPIRKNHDAGIEQLGLQEMKEAYEKLFKVIIHREQDLSWWRLGNFEEFSS